MIGMSGGKEVEIAVYYGDETDGTALPTSKGELADLLEAVDDATQRGLQVAKIFEVTQEDGSKVDVAAVAQSYVIKVKE